MKLRTTEDMLKTVTQRWKEQYMNKDGTWDGLYKENSEEIYNKLTNIGNITKEVIKEVIGNDTWTWQCCDGCGNYSHIPHVIFEDDYDVETAVCAKCIIESYKLL